MSTDALVQLVQTVGGWGVLAWYVWYTVTVSTPKLLEAFRQENVESRRHFDSTLKDLTAKYESTADKQSRAIGKMVDHCIVRAGGQPRPNGQDDWTPEPERIADDDPIRISVQKRG